MRRIISCILLLAALLTPPAFGPSAAAGTTLIAAVMSSDQPRYRDAHRAFIKSLAARGYGSPATEIILQAPNPDQLSWSNTVRKFNAYRPALIVAYGAPAAVTAVRESDGIPVVSVDVYAAEKPQRGMCGSSSRVPLVSLVKALRDIRPYRRLGVLYTAREAGSQRQLDDIRRAATLHDMTVLDGNVTSAAGLDKALGSLLDQCEVLALTESSYAAAQIDRIIARAAALNIPVVAAMPDAADKGALASLEVNPNEQGFLAAEIAVRILEGATPEHLSLLPPSRVDLVLNLRTARQMGISIPFTVLGSAGRIVR